MNDNKQLNEAYQQVNEFAFPSRGGHHTTDFEIAHDISMHANRIEGMVNTKQLTGLSRKLQQILFEISDHAENLDKNLVLPMPFDG